MFDISEQFDWKLARHALSMEHRSYITPLVVPNSQVAHTMQADIVRASLGGTTLLGAPVCSHIPCEVPCPMLRLQALMPSSSCNTTSMSICIAARSSLLKSEQRANKNPICCRSRSR